MDQPDRPDEREVDTDTTMGEATPEPTGTTGTTENDAELQKEGNLGNERNRNEPDAERLPGGSREHVTE